MTDAPRQESPSPNDAPPQLSVWRRARRLLRPLARRLGLIQGPPRYPKEPPFEYSSDWYDRVYRQGRLHVDRRHFADVNQQYEVAGYRRRLEEVLRAAFEVPPEGEWLEVGCHMGLTSFWVASMYPAVRLHMMDFSEEAVAWCHREFPLPERATIWRASVEDIRRPEAPLDAFFDFATCVDVTEHLPDPVYRRAIAELHRVLKPGGLLILMQGVAPNVEHIHVLPEEELVRDFEAGGFSLVRTLPARHHLLRRV